MSDIILLSSDGQEFPLSLTRFFRIFGVASRFLGDSQDDMVAAESGYKPTVSVDFKAAHLSFFLKSAETWVDRGFWPANPKQSLKKLLKKPDSWRRYNYENYVFGECDFWEAYFGMISYFDVQQPILDEIYASYLLSAKYYSKPDEPTPQEDAKSVGYEYARSRIDRIIDIGIQASHAADAFACTWKTFQVLVFQAVRSNSRCFDCCTWMELVTHPRWHLIRSQDLMRIATLAFKGHPLSLDIPPEETHVATITSTHFPSDPFKVTYSASLGPHHALEMVVYPTEDDDEDYIGIYAGIRRRSRFEQVVKIEGTVRCRIGEEEHMEDVYIVQWFDDTNKDDEKQVFMELLDVDPENCQVPVTLSVSLTFQFLFTKNVVP